MKFKLFVFTLFLTLNSSPELFGNTPPSEIFKTTNDTSTVVNLIYKNGTLNIKGLTGVGTIRIYSIIGNEIKTFPNANLSDFKREIVLSPKTMFIVRIETSMEVKTYKLVTR